jgi:hypothetical protein
MLSAILLRAIMLNDIMMSSKMLSVILIRVNCVKSCVITLGVVVLSVAAPQFFFAGFSKSLNPFLNMSFMCQFPAAVWHTSKTF